jgi:anti-sigma factor RsiW
MGPFDYQRYRPTWRKDPVIWRRRRRCPDPVVWRGIGAAVLILAAIGLAAQFWIMAIGELARVIAP